LYLQDASPRLDATRFALRSRSVAADFWPAAFATLAREPPDTLFVGPGNFFSSHRVQFAILSARDRIPAAYSSRDYVAAGGPMSYGTDNGEVHRQVGA
jgi:putative ABC transport system substrate-binding protein